MGHPVYRSVTPWHKQARRRVYWVDKQFIVGPTTIGICPVGSTTEQAKLQVLERLRPGSYQFLMRYFDSPHSAHYGLS